MSDESLQGTPQADSNIATPPPPPPQREEQAQEQEQAQTLPPQTDGTTDNDTDGADRLLVESVSSAAGFELSTSTTTEEQGRQQQQQQPIASSSSSSVVPDSDEVGDTSLDSLDSGEDLREREGEGEHEQEHEQDWNAVEADHESKRVKVYELIGSRWVDQGTAFCFGQFSEQTQEALLLARSESDFTTVILSTTIRASDVYQRQQDTLIVWTEPDGVDYALSFQDPEGCAEVWNFIVEVQQHMNGSGSSSSSPAHNISLGPDPASPSPGGGDPSTTSSSSSSAENSTAAMILRTGHLPPPSLEGMAEVEKAIKVLCRQALIKERLCEYIQLEEYVRGMIAVFEEAEGRGLVGSLHEMCGLMQTILMMNDHALYEHVLSDSLFPGVCGILSYDPDFPTHRANYRTYLSLTSRFHSPIPLDPLLARKVHSTYRLQFLKDVVLARALDDSTFNVLNSCIIFNHCDIIAHVQGDAQFLRGVVGLYVDEDMLSGGGVLARERKREVEAQLMLAKQGAEGTTTAMDVDLPKGSEEDAAAAANGDGAEAATGKEREREREEKETLHRNRVTVMLLVHSLTQIGKSVQLPARLALFRTLVDRGILFAVQWALSQPEDTQEGRSMIGVGGEILGVLLDHDLNGVRGHVLKQVGAIERERDISGGGGGGGGGGGEGVREETVLGLVCRMLAASKDLSVQSQIGDSLKMLMDIPEDPPAPAGLTPAGGTPTPAAGGANTPQKILAQKAKDDPNVEKFLGYFYEKCFKTLFRPLTSSVPPFSSVPPSSGGSKAFTSTLSRERTNLYVYLLDLLSQFYKQHSFRSHFAILSESLLSRAATLLGTRDKHLKVAAFRFFRALVDRERMNPQVLMIMEREGVMRPILECVERETRRDSLLCCAVVEYFEWIRNKNQKDLIEHICSAHEATIRRLAASPLVGSRFAALLDRWQLNRNPPPIEQDRPKAPEPRRIASHINRMEAEAEEDYLISDDWGSEDVLGEDDAPPMIASRQGVGSLGNSPIATSMPMPFRTLRRRPGFRPLTPTPTPPRTPIMGTLVDYGDEEEEGEGAGSPQSVASTSATSPPDTEHGAATQTEPEDEEDAMLEALVTRKVVLPEPPMRLAEKRRREEEEEEDGMEMLASKKKKPESAKTGPTTRAAQRKNGDANGGGSTQPFKQGDDPPPSKKIKMKFGSSMVAAASSSRPNGRSGDGG